jgi:UDP-N-acetyl-D-glucosamine dehydrogenase
VLNQAAKPVMGSRIAVFGVSYKPGVGDVRESPALKIIALLGALGADLVYHDPHVPALPERGMQSHGFDEALEGADLALIVTAHPGVDHEAIAERAPLVVDLRGVTRHSAARRTVLL